MGKWFYMPCEKCEETGSLCSICYGEQEIPCPHDENDGCEECNFTGAHECDDASCIPCPDCKDSDRKGHRSVYIGECGECHKGRVGCDCQGMDDDCPACSEDDKTHPCPACEGTGFDAYDISDAGLTVDEFRRLFL